ncbi:hypothetical protein D3C83_14630 [compost metagenome]
MAERRAREIERREGDAATLERGKQRLLPLGMLVQDDEIGLRRHAPGSIAFMGTCIIIRRVRIESDHGEGDEAWRD